MYQLKPKCKSLSQPSVPVATAQTSSVAPTSAVHHAPQAAATVIAAPPTAAAQPAVSAAIGTGSVVGTASTGNRSVEPAPQNLQTSRAESPFVMQAASKTASKAASTSSIPAAQYRSQQASALPSRSSQPLNSQQRSGPVLAPIDFDISRMIVEPSSPCVGGRVVPSSGSGRGAETAVGWLPNAAG